MSRLKTPYAPKRDKATLDKMVTDYLPLVRYIVGRLPIQLPALMDTDDLMSVGVLGLIHAANTYDPDRGASFKTYAYTNIKGSILDELRRHDTVPRSTRDKMKKVEKATSRLMEQHGRVPTPDEISEALGMTKKALDDLFVSARATLLFSLNDQDFELNEAGGLLDALPGRNSMNPADLAEQSEIKALLVQALKKLPEAERQVVFLYYNKNMLLREIGEVLTVSESRVCQILSRAHFLLNKEIEHLGG